MSKTVERDHEPNRDNLITLLRLSQGDRSQTAFCKSAKISKAYWSKQLNKNADVTLPIPSTLRKIADASQGRVELKDLLNAAGFNPDKYVVSPTLPAQAIRNSKHAMDGLRWELQVKEYIEKKMLTIGDGEVVRPQSLFDLMWRSEKDQSIKNWYFLLSSCPSDIPAMKRLIMVYAVLAMEKIDSDTVITIVTDSQNLFDKFFKSPPISLNMNISVALMDSSRQRVIREETLITRSDIDSDDDIRRFRLSDIDEDNSDSESTKSKLDDLFTIYL